MDALEIQYDSLEVVPETFRALYSEKDGKAVLTGINGLKTVHDVAALSEALRKERADHALAREALKPWTQLGKKPDEILTQLDRMTELELAASGKIDEKQINTLVEGRLSQKLGPVERQLRDVTEKYGALEKENSVLKDNLYTRDMSDAIRSVATEMKVLSTAIPDVEMFAKFAMERQEDGTFITKAGIQGVTPGMDAKGFLKEMQKLRPHWWPASAGGGANGGGGFGGEVNPWSASGWNVTAQANVVREKGMAHAETLAKAAGSFVGATKPKK